MTINKELLVDWLKRMQESNKVPFPDSEAAYWLVIKRVERGDFNDSPVMCQGICTSQLDDYCGMHMSNESCIACNAIWTNAHVENVLFDKAILSDHLGDINYGLSCLEPLIGIPEKGYVRNQFNRLVETCKEFRHVKELQNGTT